MIPEWVLEGLLNNYINEITKTAQNKTKWKPMVFAPKEFVVSLHWDKAIHIQISKGQVWDHIYVMGYRVDFRLHMRMSEGMPKKGEVN